MKVHCSLQTGSPVKFFKAEIAVKLRAKGARHMRAKRAERVTRPRSARFARQFFFSRILAREPVRRLSSLQLCTQCKQSRK